MNQAHIDTIEQRKLSSGYRGRELASREIREACPSQSVYSGSTDTPLAVFDLDGTLLRSDSFLPFLTSYARRSRRYRGLLRMPVELTRYMCRLVKDFEVKERLMVQLLGGASLCELREHIEWFCSSWLPRQLHPLGMSLLKKHQAQGHRVILLSASPDVYVPAIAAELGITEVLCTRVACRNGICQGTIEGVNCKGLAKLKMLREHLGLDAAPQNSHAYGDSAHDLHVLRWVEYGWMIGKRRSNRVLKPDGNLTASLS